MHNRLILNTGAGGSGADGGAGGHGGEAPVQLHYNHYGPQVIYMSSSNPTNNQATTAGATASVNAMTFATTGNFNPHEDWLGPLPPGWERREDPQGPAYYFDHSTRTATWDRPSANERADNRGAHNANANATTRDDPILSNVPQYKHEQTPELKYFYSQLRLLSQPGTCHINVRRSHILGDSYTEIMRRNPNDLKKRLLVKFKGEDGLDYYDPSREILLLLSPQMFDPHHRLFCYSPVDRYQLQINPASGTNPTALHYFRFIGRYLGLVVFHRHFLDVSFVVSFYKIMLNKNITLSDMRSINAGNLLEHFPAVNWILENDILNKTFSTTHYDPQGELVTVELKPNGRGIPVTEENEEEYVEAIIDYYILRHVRPEFDAFMYGFNELISPELIYKLLISRVPDIDVDDWMEFTDYWGYEENDEVIQWFWQVIQSWPSTRRSRLLKFATGTPRIPINGFRDLRGSDGPRRFTIAKSGNPRELPKSQVSFNIIELPPYKDYATLVQMLTRAVEATVGFGPE